MSADHASMKIASAVATEVGREGTARELVAGVLAALGNRPVDLCLLFASAHFEDELESLALEIHDLLRARAFIGATGESVIGGETEYEHRPAISLWAAHLPGAHVTSFHLSQEDLERLESPEDLHEHLNVRPEDAPSFVLLGDPFSIDALGLLDRLESAYAGRPAIGGMASAGEEPGQNVLVFEGQALRHGLSGVALWANVRVDTIVSQGCRPIGHHLVITKADRNVIFQLGGKPPLGVLKEILEASPARDVGLARRRGLLVGRVINEYQANFARGDFVIRNPLGFDADTGAMAVNDLVRTGQTIQFHVRDGRSATEDLDLLLESSAGDPPAGALLFSCNGRGTRLFRERSHDARAVLRTCGATPLAGMFCAGEIGPVGRRNFLHGHTAVIGLLRPRGPEPDG